MGGVGGPSSRLLGKKELFWGKRRVMSPKGGNREGGEKERNAGVFLCAGRSSPSKKIPGCQLRRREGGKGIVCQKDLGSSADGGGERESKGEFQEGVARISSFLAWGRRA